MANTKTQCLITVARAWMYYRSVSVLCAHIHVYAQSLWYHLRLIVSEFVVASLRASCGVRLFVLDLITLKIVHEEYKR
jgi:ABC-type sulfate transport system permease subunit